MSYDYEIHDDNTKYAVEYIIHQDLPLGFRLFIGMINKMLLKKEL